MVVLLNVKNIKILIAAHKPWELPTDSLYLPVHVGSVNKESIGYQRDDEGENISSLNPYFSELTALYWAWKNLSVDYLGLVHYRRYFTKSNMNKSGSIDERVIDKNSLVNALNEENVLVPKKRNYYIETLKSHYEHTLDTNHLNITREIIQNRSPEYLTAFDQVMNQRGGYMYNMFIMSKKLSDQYCEWLFPILFELFEKIGTEHLTGFEQRYPGRVSELLFNVWLKQNQLSVKEIPYHYEDSINWFKKGMSFLGAKFFGKKYTKSF